MPPATRWVVAFEREGEQYRSPLRTTLSVQDGTLAVYLKRDSVAAIGISALRVSDDLSAFDEIRLWVRSDAALSVQPYTQSSGFIFRDGGFPDVTLPADGTVIPLRIRRDSMADSSMVQAVGVQVRPGAGTAWRRSFPCTSGFSLRSPRFGAERTWDRLHGFHL